MKFFALKSLLFSILMISIISCSSEKKQETNEPEEEIAVQQPEENEQYDILSAPLASVSDVEDWVAEVVMSMNSLKEPDTDPKRVVLGGVDYEVVVSNPKGKLKVIRAGAPTWENLETGWRYVTRGDDVVLLEELVKTENGLAVNKYYFGDKGYLGATTREASSMDELGQAIPKSYDPSGRDIKWITNSDEVKKRSAEFLKSVLGG